MTNRLDNSNKEEESILLCMPCTHAKGLDTATKTQCGMCQQDVWIAPSGLALLQKDTRNKAICFVCALADPEIRAEMSKQPVRIHPDQREEIKDQFKTNARRKAERN